jgi:hypothetical protein
LDVTQEVRSIPEINASLPTRPLKVENNQTAADGNKSKLVKTKGPFTYKVIYVCVTE